MCFRLSTPPRGILQCCLRLEYLALGILKYGSHHGTINQADARGHLCSGLGAET